MALLITSDDENEDFMWIKVKMNMFSGSTCTSIAAEKVSPPLNEGSYCQGTDVSKNMSAQSLV